VIAGKGGVGKSTVAAATALGAALTGRRTLVVELAGRSDVARLLGGQGHGELVEGQLERDLFHISIGREEVLEDYLEHEVPGPFPAGRLAGSRTFSLFVDATPGMGELLAIGKVWELTRRPRRRKGGRTYDLVVLDGPASGQLIGLLKAPRTFGAIARVGPVARQTAEIDRLLRDPRLTGVVAVTTPEQMAVTEALALRDGLATLGVALDAAVVNRTVSFSVSRTEETALRSTPDDSAVASALWLSERTRAQRKHLDRLRRELPNTARARLPFIFEELDRAGAETLAQQLVRL
jgi:anion-transporting  ArsA/GET3 family ATPase